MIGLDLMKRSASIPRKLPFDVAVGSLHRLVEGMVPGEELVLTVQGEPKAIGRVGDFIR